MQSSVVSPPGKVFRHTRQPGYWISVAMAMLMLVNAARCVIDPLAFSVYMGLPVTTGQALAWVGVYGLRALFIGLLAGYFVWRCNPEPLQWLAAFALVMPLGDAWLVYTHGGTTVWRHLLIAGVLIVATVSIRTWNRGVLRHERALHQGA